MRIQEKARAAPKRPAAARSALAPQVPMQGAGGMDRRLLVLGAAASMALPRRARAARPVLGMTLPQSGVQAEVARELEVGYRLACAEAGLDLRLMDDASVPDRVADNIRRLAADPAVMALSGIVGTPHAEAGLAAAKDAGLPLIGIRSGAQFLRNGDTSVFHLRVSYEDELDKMVAYCRGVGIQRMAILFSQDSFGTSSSAHLASRLAAAGITLASSIAVERSGANMADAARRTAEAVRGGFGAVALLLIVKPMMEAARALRITHSIALPILAMSFTITGGVATSQDKALSGLGLTSAFPLPRAGGDLRRRFRDALARERQPAALAQSVTAYEGYFYGTVAGRALLGTGGREAVARRLHAGLSLESLRIDFSRDMVGYRHLEFLHKSRDGLLRS